MCTHAIKKIQTLLLSAILVCALSFPVAGVKTAYADELDDAKAALSAAESELNAIAAEYSSLQNQASALEEEIAQATEQILVAQEAMVDGQMRLGTVVASSYKSGTISFLNIFLESDSLDSFIKSCQYYESIQEAHAKQIEEQKKLKDEFNAQLEELDKKRDAQEEVLKQAAAKQQQAAEVVSKASAKVSNIESERERLAALQAAAQQMQEQTNNQNAANNPNNDPDSNASSSANNGSSNSGNSSSSNNSNSSSSPANSSGWKTGVASAYGGSSDPSAPVGSHTATGAVVTNSSMGVAVPMAWPNYRSYFGRIVEINYNGRTVVATVNDCGGMGGGSRSLDLQPGVFKAFGFNTCQAWGLRTVSYRFL